MTHSKMRRAAREQAGLSLEQLAHRIGRRVGTVKRYEREGVPFHLARAWAHHCACPLDVLL